MLDPLGQPGEKQQQYFESLVLTSMTGDGLEVMSQCLMEAIDQGAENKGKHPRGRGHLSKWDGGSTEGRHKPNSTLQQLKGRGSKN